MSLILLSWIPVLIVLMFKYLCILINWTGFKARAVDGFKYEDWTKLIDGLFFLSPHALP